jgi:hypothetical protein
MGQQFSNSTATELTIFARPSRHKLNWRKLIWAGFPEPILILRGKVGVAHPIVIAGYFIPCSAISTVS